MERSLLFVTSALSAVSFSRLLHEFNRGAVGIADVNDALSSIRTSGESLRFAGRFPTGRRDFFENGVEFIDRERDMD